MCQKWSVLRECGRSMRVKRHPGQSQEGTTGLFPTEQENDRIFLTQCEPMTLTPTWRYETFLSPLPPIPPCHFLVKWKVEDNFHVCTCLSRFNSDWLLCIHFLLLHFWERIFISWNVFILCSLYVLSVFGYYLPFPIHLKIPFFSWHGNNRKIQSLVYYTS